MIAASSPAWALSFLATIAALIVVVCLMVWWDERKRKRNRGKKS